MNTTIRVAQTDDLSYINKLQRQNAEELSFYPMTVFEREVPNARILLAEVNGAPAGYIYHGSFENDCKIHQACIQYDARRAQHGADIVRFLTQLCGAAGSTAITLRCGSDIDANFFWTAMGFQCVGVSKGGVRRQRDINAWRHELHPTLFETVVEPSTTAQDASLWRASRVEGVTVSQFLRGKGMKAYRKYLENVAQEPNL